MPTIGLTMTLLVASAMTHAQELPDFTDLRLPDPLPRVPGPEYAPPVTEQPSAEAAPVIYAHTRSALSDETVFLNGAGFGPDFLVWGLSPKAETGAQLGVKVTGARDDMAFVTINQGEQDALYLLWPGREGAWGAPVRINAPEPWWCTPDRVPVGGTVGVYGRDLAALPDRAEAYVYLVKPGAGAVRVPPESIRLTNNALEFNLPAAVGAGDWEIWVHAGVGGKYGWGGPLALQVLPQPDEPRFVDLSADATATTIQQAMDGASDAGGAVVRLPAGSFELDANLVVPDNVTLAGAGRDATTLRLPAGRRPGLSSAVGGRWGEGPSSVHTVGDTLVYEVNVPTAGEYAVWVRYGCDMKPWGQDDMGGHFSLTVGGAEPAPLMNLPNTGGWNPTAWSRSATLALPQGKTRLTWRNDTGGGITIDAYVLSLDPDWSPGEAVRVEPAEGLIIVQADDPVEMTSREGRLPGQTRAVVWLAGDSSGVRDLTLVGSQHVTIGVHIRSRKEETWLEGATLDGVRILGVTGIGGENCGVLIERAQRVRIEDCEITARAPIFMRGLRQGTVRGNRLTSITRFGGNAEGAILGRTDTVNQSVFVDNYFASPKGAGGPTQRRMIWISTGHGSVDDNYFARNTSQRMQWGGIAGTDQNVGEMILFEANMRVAWYGGIEGADATSVTLPAEGPFDPPESEWETEPALTSYYLQIVQGPGMGQVRRVAGREGQRLLMDRPWRVAPDAGSRVVMSNLYVHNIVEDNETNDGMTGIQLWIGCYDNIVVSNRIARQRKQGIFLYGTYTTDAPTMVNTWNRGVGIFWFNDTVGNLVEDTQEGILLTSGEGDLPPSGWPRVLGNTIRHNTLINSRFNGINISARRAQPEETIHGTVAEFNVIRDQPVGILANDSARQTMLRRNHLYFWHNWTPETPPTAFDIRGTQDVFIEHNSVEGKRGTMDQAIIEQKTE